MNIDIVETNELVDVFIKCELNLIDSKEMKVIFNKAADAGKNVVLDLAECDYLDSSGLGELIALNKKVHDNGKELIVVNINDHINPILEMCSFKKFFKVAKDGS